MSRVSHPSFDLEARTWTDDSGTRPLNPHDAHRIWVRSSDRTPAMAKKIVVACCASVDPHVEKLSPEDALEILQM